MKDSTAITTKTKFILKQAGIVTCPRFPVMPGKVCNLDYLIAITRGNEISMNTIVDVFFKETSRELLALKYAINKTNFAAIRDLTHKLKPAFLILGISVLNPVFKEMEQLSSNTTHLKKMIKLNRQVNTVFIRAKKEMKNKKPGKLL